MRHDQVAIGDDTYETTTLPAYMSVSSCRQDQSEDMHPLASCENLAVSILFRTRIQLKGQSCGVHRMRRSLVLLAGLGSRSRRWHQ